LIFSVPHLCPLCLCGENTAKNIHHRDAEDTKVAQRRNRTQPRKREC